MLKLASRILAAAIPLSLAAVPALAQKVYIDYDKTADLKSYKTYAFALDPEGDLSQRAPLMHQRVLAAIRAEIALKEVESNPDVLITYHVSSKEETSVSTSYGSGWGGGYYYHGGGWAPATTTVTTYEVGTLVIDVQDAAKKQAVWRGIAQATVPGNPEKGAKKIEKAIQKMADKWRSMKGGA